MQSTTFRVLWYSYIGMLLALGIGRTLYSLIYGNVLQVSAIYPVLSASVIGLGIYGFVKKQSYFQQFIWKVVFWLCTLISATLAAFFIYLLSMYQQNSQSVIYIGVSVILFLPCQYALFNYVYADETLWTSDV